jgi:uncharacterized lipoprotein YehR (DUF1307 family)
VIVLVLLLMGCGDPEQHQPVKLDLETKPIKTELK